MELDERMNLFANMISLQKTVYLFCYNADFEVVASNCPDERLMATLFAGSGSLDKLKAGAEGGAEAMLLSSEIGVLWGGVYCRENGVLGKVYLLGPVLGAEMNARDMEAELTAALQIKTGSRLPKEERTLEFKFALMEKLNRLPVIMMHRFVEYLLMLGYYTTGAKLKQEDVLVEQVDPVRPVKPRKDRYRTWMAEQALMHMVREGDLNYSAALQNSASVSNGVPVQVKDSMQQAKVSSITFVTLCVRAAIDGGLTPDTAYTVGDGYVQQILDCKTLAAIGEINHVMYDDFVRRVHSARTNPACSAQIQNCMDYIELHVEEHIDIGELAKLTGYTEYYLSRKFKEETKCCINDYLKIVRVERAKLLLYTTDESIGEIAARLDFCSGSYFATVFRQFAGLSPAEYRRSKIK